MFWVHPRCPRCGGNIFTEDSRTYCFMCSRPLEVKDGVVFVVKYISNGRRSAVPILLSAEQEKERSDGALQSPRSSYYNYPYMAPYTPTSNNEPKEKVTVIR